MMTGMLAIVFFAIIYLSRRFAGYFSLENTWPLYILFTVIVFGMMFGVMGLTNSLNPFAHIIYMVSGFFMGFMIYLLVAQITMDLGSLIVNIKPLYKGLITIGVALSISLYGIINAFTIRTNEVDLTIKDLDQEIKVAHLTDIHLGHYRSEDFLKRLVKKTNAQNPDIVVITGDLFDGRIALKDEIFKIMGSFDSPVYFVEGNHDVYTNTQAIKKQLEQEGVHVLVNEVAEYKGLQIVGLDHMRADTNTFDMHAQNGHATIASVLPKLNIDKNKASILLHHSPDGIQYAEKEGIDLYLSGHTHAGQLFPANIVARQMFNYNSGLHQYKSSRIFVSEGIGTFGPPMRVGTRSEMILFNLKK
jgi:predicted MPP superfamily phosphohydrolase